MRAILLDSGPLGMLVHRGGVREIDACKAWLEKVLVAGERVIVPEICDYEVRRELLRIGSTASVERLDKLDRALEYMPLTTDVIRAAATMWAETRGRGRVTADKHALDGDVILAAQAKSIDAMEAVIATTNVQHLGTLARAMEWTAV